MNLILIFSQLHHFNERDVDLKLNTEEDSEMASSSRCFLRGTQWAAGCKIVPVIELL